MLCGTTWAGLGAALSTTKSALHLNRNTFCLGDFRSHILAQTARAGLGWQQEACTVADAGPEPPRAYCARRAYLVDIAIIEDELARLVRHAGIRYTPVGHTQSNCCRRVHAEQESKVSELARVPTPQRQKCARHSLCAVVTKQQQLRWSDSVSTVDTRTRGQIQERTVNGQGN